jgi:hypothetical protein
MATVDAVEPFLAVWPPPRSWRLAAQLARLNREWRAAIRQHRAQLCTVVLALADVKTTVLCDRYTAVCIDRSTAIDTQLLLVSRECPRLRNLTIELCRCKHYQRSSSFVSDSALAAVASGCPSLGDLEVLGDCGITDKALVVLGRGCRNLHRLHLGGCDQSPHKTTGITAVIACCAQLQELVFDFKSAVSNHLVQLMASCLPSLNHLCLDGQKISDEALWGTNWPSLTCLQLRSDSPTFTGAFFEAMSCPSLKKLDCWPIHVQHLESSCPLLEVLRTGESNDDWSLFHHSRLIQLDVSETGFTAKGLSLATLPSLTWLDASITESHMTDETVCAMFSKECHALNSLSLACTDVASPGVKALCQHGPGLTFLDLFATRLDDDCISALCSLPKLKYLHLGSNWGITDTGVKGLLACQPLRSLDYILDKDQDECSQSIIHMVQSVLSERAATTEYHVQRFIPFIPKSNFLLSLSETRNVHG